MEDVPGAGAPLSRPRTARPGEVHLRVARPGAPLEHWLALTLAAPAGPTVCRRLAQAFPDAAALGACLCAARSVRIRSPPARGAHPPRR